MEKLRIRRKKPPVRSYGTPIRIRADTDELITTVAEEAGLTKIDVIDKMVAFAYQNIEWINYDESEEK